MTFRSFCIATTRISDLTVSVYDKHMRYHLHSHCTTEFAIRIK